MESISSLESKAAGIQEAIRALTRQLEEVRSTSNQLRLDNEKLQNQNAALLDRIRSMQIESPQAMNYLYHLEAFLGPKGLKKARSSYEKYMSAMIEDVRAESVSTNIGPIKKRCSRGYRRAPDGVTCIKKISQRRRRG